MPSYYFDVNRQIIGPVGPEAPPPESYGEVDINTLDPNTIVKGDVTGQLVDLTTHPRDFFLFDLPQQGLTITYSTPFPPRERNPSGQDQVAPMVFRQAGLYSAVEETQLDSALIADRTRVITRIRMLRKTGGGSGATIGDVRINGNSIVPVEEVSPLLIAYSAPANAQVVVLPTVSTVRPGDVVTAWIVEADAPVDDAPNGLVIQVEFTPSTPGIPDVPPAAPVPVLEV